MRLRKVVCALKERERLSDTEILLSNILMRILRNTSNFTVDILQR